MNHVLSTHLIVNHRLNTVWLDRIQRAGIPAVEIFCARQHLDWLNRAQVVELGHWFRASELKLWSLHSPMYTDDVWGRSGPQSVVTLTEPVKSKRIQHVDEVKRALEVAEIIPFRYLIQHLGVSGEEWSEAAIDAAFTALEELKIFARQRGVEILIENIPNGLSSAERLTMFVDATHLNLGFCLDTGHANLDGRSVAASFGIMKERIRSTHIHDNDGQKDSHLFPFLAEGGTIDWKETARLLASRGDQYPLLLELKEDPAQPAPFESAARIFDRLEELAAAPAEEGQ